MYVRVHASTQRLSDRSKRITKKINILNVKVKGNKFKRLPLSKQTENFNLGYVDYTYMSAFSYFIFKLHLYTAHSLWGTRNLQYIRVLRTYLYIIYIHTGWHAA